MLFKYMKSVTKRNLPLWILLCLQIKKIKDHKKVLILCFRTKCRWGSLSGAAGRRHGLAPVDTSRCPLVGVQNLEVGEKAMAIIHPMRLWEESENDVEPQVLTAREALFSPSPLEGRPTKRKVE
uniref:Uncharacterized protein n=1 Tax=Zea mays TaxID=4577 RepID=C4J3A7_MAIZE|nr:unknown [Zea mays]